MPKYKFGFCAWYTPFPGPFALTFAGEVGYDGVQISDLGGEDQAFPLKNKRVQKGFRDVANTYCLEIQMVNLFALGLSGMMKFPQNSGNGKLALESLKKGIEACSEMGIPSVFIPCVFSGRIENEFDMDTVASYLKYADPIAKEHGVNLLFESFMGYDKTMQLYEKAGYCFKLCYDSLNPIKYGFGDAVQELRQYEKSMIHTIHIKDCANDFQSAELIGKGRGKFNEIAEVIIDIGYTGWIVNENNYFRGELAKHRDPQDMIRYDLETFRNTFQN